MAKNIIIVLFALLLNVVAYGQEPTDGLQPISVNDSIPEGYYAIDTVIYRHSSRLDDSLAGKNIFSILPKNSEGTASQVSVHQSKEIWDAMYAHFENNKTRGLSGYRVRIFFDNKRTARAESEQTLKNFTSQFPDTPAYRSYSNPYFKVTVGDFRTKSEAMQLLKRIKNEFPSAFIVKETISYPVIDKNNPVVIDTVRIFRQIEEQTNL